MTRPLATHISTTFTRIHPRFTTRPGFTSPWLLQQRLGPRLDTTTTTNRLACSTTRLSTFVMPPKRNVPAAAAAATSKRKREQVKIETDATNPLVNTNVMDSASALRASPDATDENERGGGGGDTEMFDLNGQVRPQVEQDPVGGQETNDTSKPSRRGRAGSSGRGRAAARGGGAGRGRGRASTTAAKDEQDFVKEDSPLSSLDEQPTSGEEEEEEAKPVVKKAKRTPTKSSIAAKKGADEIKAFKAAQAAANGQKSVEAGGGEEGAAAGNGEGGEEKGDAFKLEARRPPPSTRPTCLSRGKVG